ncbi:unnamed protein product, partial [Didymodactylos carnosus]
MSDDHSSPMRSMISSAHGEEYEAIKNFNDAKTTENCVLIFEGDYGGQIYLTCPMKYVQCNEQILKQLLNDIDKLQWDDEQGCRMYYEIHKIGDDQNKSIER